MSSNQREPDTRDDVVHEVDQEGAPHTPISKLSEATATALSLQDIFALLYADYPHKVSKQVSRQERKDNEYVSMSLVYGEIAYQPFKTVLDQLKRWHHVLVKPGGVFLDIGSGSGKAVFAAALAHDFDACHGIEILEGLHQISQDVLSHWERSVKKLAVVPMLKKRTRIYFTHGDALDENWPTGADVVFLNSTCFSQSLLNELTRRLSAWCKPGSIVITATHALPDQQNFDQLRTMTVQQEAWGDATWFIHRKK